MRTMLALVALVSGTVAMAACNDDGGTSGDEAAIEALARDLYRAFENKDAAGVIDTFIADCPNIEQDVEDGLALFEGLDIAIDINEIDVRMLGETEAEVQASGTITIDGEEQELEKSGFVSVIKTGGEWKYSNCEFISSPA